MRHDAVALAAASLLLLAPSVAAAPPFCADVGPSVTFGVSSFGTVRDWAPVAKEQYGADLRFLYVYVLAGGMEAPSGFESYYVRPFIEDAQQMGATPVLTFYQLLDLGIAAGLSGAEEDIVRLALQDPVVMRRYFDHFVWLLAIAQSYPPPVVVHVEPDSWGFMMWAMGVDGNADPTTVPVQVASSGHPDLAECSDCDDDAAGFGRALVALRDAHAPDVRLGWHASNFRVGARPDVVASFYAAMGSWDLLVGEHPHLEPSEATWWEPWSEDAVATNLAWMGTVTSSAGIPLLLWQMPIGTTDWHLIAEGSDRSMLTRFAEQGVVGLLFEHQNFHEADAPDDYRAAGVLGTAPPAEHADACGTAGCMRARVAGYSAAPLSWPDASICAAGASGGSGSGSGGSGAGATGGGGSGQGGDCQPPCGSASTVDSTDDAGCGCRLPQAQATGPLEQALGLGLGLGLGLVRRARARRRR